MDVMDFATKLCEGYDVYCSYDNGNEEVPMEITGELFNMDEEDGVITIDIAKASGIIRIPKENIQNITEMDDMVEVTMENGCKYILTGG